LRQRQQFARAAYAGNEVVAAFRNEFRRGVEVERLDGFGISAGALGGGGRLERPGDERYASVAERGEMIDQGPHAAGIVHTDIVECRARRMGRLPVGRGAVNENDRQTATRKLRGFIDIQALRNDDDGVDIPFDEGVDRRLAGATVVRRAGDERRIAGGDEYGIEAADNLVEDWIGEIRQDDADGRGLARHQRAGGSGSLVVHFLRHGEDPRLRARRNDILVMQGIRHRGGSDAQCLGHIDNRHPALCPPPCSHLAPPADGFCTMTNKNVCRNVFI